MSHARLSPSSAKRWMTCPASVAREAGLDDRTSEAAEWGTCAHAVLEKSLLQQVSPLDVDLEDIQIDKDGDSRGEGFFLVDRYGIWDLQEMRDTAAVAYDYVLFQGEIYAESKSDPGQVIGRDDCSGTADITVVNPMELEVVDLKAGKGVVVEPDDPQLWLYALGKMAEHYRGQPREVLSQVKIKTTVVQPRAPHKQGPIRSCVMVGEDLLVWAKELFKPAAEATDDPNAPAVPSEAGCRFCKAKATCPELAAQGLSAAQAVFQPVPTPESGNERQGLADKLTRDPGELTVEELQFILDHEKLISGWLKAVREHASEHLLSGNRLPGYKMVAGRGSRKWDFENEEEVYSTFRNFTTTEGKKLTKNHLYVSTPLSPAQAEKQIKPLVKKSTWERIEAHIVKSKGAPTLAPESDPRPALLTNAQDVFEPISQETEEEIPDWMK